MFIGSRFLKPAVFAAALALGLGIAAIPAQALFADGVNIDTAFPDKAFREYVKEEFDSNHDGSLSQTEINAVKRVNLCDLGVKDITGIGVFTKAEEIWSEGGGGPKSMDFSKNTELQRLYCGDSSDLTSLNISGCTKLTLLDCCNSGISKLDVSKMPDLTKLVCYGTKLSSLDVSKNTNLTYLDCSESDITEVDVANCPGLIKAMTDSDYYGEGYFSRYYHCEDNNYYLGIPLNAIAGIPLIEKYFPNSDFRDYLQEGTSNGNYPAADTDLDGFLTVSELKAVKKINCGELGITSIKGIEYFINLELLWGGMSEIPEYDLSRNVNLVELHLGSNDAATEVDLSKNTKLQELDCAEMENLKSVKLGNQPDLKTADFSRTAISELDISRCPNLKKAVYEGEVEHYIDTVDYDYNNQYYLSVPSECRFGIPVDDKHFPDDGFRAFILDKYCQGSTGTGFLSVDTIDGVENMWIYDMGWGIKNLKGIEYFPELRYLFFDHAPEVTDIDVSMNTELESLDVSKSKIIDLDVTNNSKLRGLDCSDTGLIHLDVSKNIELEYLDLDGCASISKIDLTKNAKLKEFSCIGSGIRSIDISKNTMLDQLYCVSEYIHEVDISDCPHLIEVLKEGEFNEFNETRTGIKCNYFFFDGDSRDYYLQYNADAKLIVDKPAPTPTKAPTAVPTKAPTATPTKAPVIDPTKTPTKAPTKGPDKMPTIKPSKKVSITLNKDSVQIKCGGSVQLKATVTGTTEKVTWKSSNIKVAQVDKTGKVVGKQAGLAEITASVAGKSASCKVTVLYKDVSDKKDFWFKPTNYLTAKGVVKGYDKQTTFRPNAECSRAQMVTFLWRLQGEPAPKAKSTSFKDVKKDDYYFKAVIWAVEKGITTGVSKTKFNPTGACTRAQTVTFLWRMANKPTVKGASNPFSDVKKTDYFYKAVIWASAKKIVAGYDNGTFKPQGKCLRRQMVTFLYKYDNVVNAKK